MFIQYSKQYLAKISSLEESINKEKSNLAELKIQADILQVFYSNNFIQ